jgi:signal transduction histidine kinase
MNFKFKTDEIKLKQIIINLISNAIKFTNEGSIQVEVIDMSQEIMIKVSDTGIGIKPEDQTLIFEKFRQVDYSSTRDYEGIGLGLSIVKQLVELHQGKIWVESEYTKGATFILTLPKLYGK